MPSTGFPSLNRIIVGIDVIWNRSAVRGLSPTFSFARRTAEWALETSSRIGATRWHGPHHSAEKSRWMKLDLRTSESNDVSVSRIGPVQVAVDVFGAHRAIMFSRLLD